MRLTILAALVLLAAPASAKSDFPAKLDTACRNAGRTPPNPAELARATGVPYADCALCHDFARGGFPSGGNDNAAGAAYKRGDLDPFCAVAVVNRPPVLAPIGGQAVSPGQPLGLLLQALDPDGDALAFSATGLPMGALYLDAGNGMASFDWTPAQAGNFAVTFTVSDGLASDSERVVISVGSVNAPPALAPIGDQTVNVGEMLALPLAASDPEGGPLAFTALGLPAGASLADFGDGSAELRFAPSAAGQADVTVTVTDAGAPPEATAETFTLTALAPGAAAGPVLEFATWNAWEGELSVSGSGAAPDSLVTLVEPAGEGALTSARAGANGTFATVARTFLAPCSVRARGANGALGSAIPVLSAPRDCGTQLLTHAKPRWRCVDGLLSVRGGRAPVSSDLRVVDAASGAVLATGQADRRGRFSLRAQSGSHANVRLQLSSGSGDWTIGPIPVRGAGETCGRKGDDDEEDDD